MVKSSDNISSKIYDQASNFGVFMTKVDIVTGTISVIIMLCIAMYLLLSKGKHSKNTKGSVKKSKCNFIRDKEGKLYKECLVNMDYNIEKKKLNNELITNIDYKEGSTVDILYNPINDKDIVIKTGMRKNIGYALILLSIFTIFGTIFKYYIVKEYKFAAASNGLGEGIGLMSIPFKKYNN